MTDNVSITAGSGTPIATDDIGGVHYQKIKVGFGDADAITVVSTGASALPIQDGGNSITVDGTVGITALTTASKIQVEGTVGVTALTTASKVQVEGTVAATFTTASKAIVEFTTASKSVVEFTTASKAVVEFSTASVVCLASTSPGVIGTGTAGSANANVLTIQGIAAMTPMFITGEIAHDAVDSGNPQKMGARASTGLSAVTLVANADRTDLIAGVDGALITRPYCNLEDITQGFGTATASTAAVTALTSVASLKQYVTHINCANTSTVNTVVRIIDNTTPEVMAFAAPANYSGFITNLPVPLKPAAAGTKWAFRTDDSASSVIVGMIGFKSKI